MFKEQMQQLISLMQLHLFQEYQPLAKIPVSQESYEFFKAFSLKNKEQQKEKTVPKKLLQPQLAPPAPDRKIAKEKTITPEKNSDGKNQAPPEDKKVKVDNAQPAPPSIANAFLDFSSLMKKCFPNKHLLNTPSEPLKDIKRAQMALLVEQTPLKQHQTFINNLQQALQQRLCPVSVINNDEHEQFLSSTTIKIFIACKSARPKLFKNFPHATIVHLEPIDDYLQNPELKRRLWKQILTAFENNR